MQDPDFVIPKLPDKIFNSIKNKKLDLKYANVSPSQTLDIYYPENGKAPYPVIFHVHGGAFMIGTKRDDNLEPMLRGLSRGYAVVSVDYRMSKESRFPAFIWDCKAALRYLRGNAKELNIDPKRIGAWGPSSGGYTVAMLGLTNKNPAFEDLSLGYAEEDSSVQAVVDWCGPCGNFLKMDEEIKENNTGTPDHNEIDSPESRILGCKITEIPELCELAAPYHYVTKNEPPFLIQHGQADPVVPVEQSETLAKALKNAGNEVILQTYPGKGHHGTPWYNETWLSDIVLDFLDQHLK